MDSELSRHFEGTSIIHSAFIYAEKSFNLRQDKPAQDTTTAKKFRKVNKTSQKTELKNSVGESINKATLLLKDTAGNIFLSINPMKRQKPAKN